MADAPTTTASADATSPAGVASAFAMLHPGVQRQLWRMGWTELRQLQVDAIRQIMTSDDPLILSGATASGKTEAVFLPILSMTADEPTGSVRTLYVGPLKALINDQFARVEELCERLELPVYRWHGDVPAAHKTKLIQQPGGVLLITPESLESLFVNRSQHLTKLFGGLRFVVIDELHSFLGDERGLHLRSLLCRLRAFAPPPVGYRPIGLSATIGDFSAAQRYLEWDQHDRVKVIVDHRHGKELKLRIHAYFEDAPPEELPPEEGDDAVDDMPPDVMQRIAEDIVKHCAGNANLVFTNAKGDVEEYADLCTRIAAARALPDQFLVHHGSLSAEIREDTERAMKGGTTATAFCSSTLEMGVDIGSVRTVGQVGPPWSVASLKQRLGRSGRRAGEPQVVRMYVRYRRPGPDADLFDRLHLDLVQAVAVTELMLEGWVEPPVPRHWDLSTLSQQVISVIAQTGGIQADRLYERLCGSGAFREIPPKSFARLLRQLARADVIEQIEGNDLILGLRGEQLRRDRGFYAVFPTPEEYSVLHGGQALGTLECAPEKDDHLLFAGKRWRVVDVDHDRLELQVAPARGWKRPKFGGAGGEVHPRVREKMREVLAASSAYVYLSGEGREALEYARQAAQTGGAITTRVLPLSGSRTAVMLWTGSRIQRTLQVLFQVGGATPIDETVALVFPVPPDIVCNAVTAAAKLAEDATHIETAAVPSGTVRKYDHLLGDELRWESVVKGMMDLEGARQVLGRLQ